MRSGMDIGGTKVETVLLDDEGNVFWRNRISTPKESFAQFLQAIVTQVRRAQEVAGQAVSLGFCLPGAPDPDSCLVKNSNIGVVNGQLLRDILSEQFAQPVAVVRAGAASHRL